MTDKIINELKKKQEAMIGVKIIPGAEPMYKRFKAWWDFQHEINKLKEEKDD